MIDAKVCNAATNTTSTMKCYVCGATSKEFNNLTKVKEVNKESLSFGLSILHARIRLFESLLHLSYKLPTKKWRITQDADKKIVKETKSSIQQKFRDELGLIIDIPKPGFGNTNDGNTSRRFFENPELAATITGLDGHLIYRLKVILEVLSSGHTINIKMFGAYAYKTAELYVKLYSWHPMTPTLHKILIHGPVIIQKALLPIGQLSEEASEARNKHFRLYRQRFARKFSREACNKDIINRLILSSDPLLTGLRPRSNKISKKFLKETLEMLLPSEHISSTNSSSEEELSSDEEGSDEEPWMPSSSE